MVSSPLGDWSGADWVAKFVNSLAGVAFWRRRPESTRPVLLPIDFGSVQKISETGGGLTPAAADQPGFPFFDAAAVDRLFDMALPLPTVAVVRFANADRA